MVTAGNVKLPAISNWMRFIARMSVLGHSGPEVDTGSVQLGNIPVVGLVFTGEGAALFLPRHVKLI